MAKFQFQLYRYKLRVRLIKTLIPPKYLLTGSLFAVLLLLSSRVACKFHFMQSKIKITYRNGCGRLSWFIHSYLSIFTDCGKLLAIRAPTQAEYLGHQNETHLNTHAKIFPVGHIMTNKTDCTSSINHANSIGLIQYIEILVFASNLFFSMQVRLACLKLNLI